MDFHNLKRRELQILCKKHKIPANLTNLEMAEKLTAYFTVNEKPLTQGLRSCLKGLDENACENEADVENRPGKKVRFSPENEMFEFERSEVRYCGIGDRGRLKSMMFKDESCDTVVTTSYDDVRQLRKSRRGNLLEVSEVERKGGKRGMKVDALRDNDIADDVVNGEVKEIRRSRRGKLLEGTEVEKGGKRGRKVDALKDNDIVEDVVKGEVSEIRQSRRGKLLEGTEIESKGGKRGGTVDALKENDIAGDVVKGEVREIRRSRRGKLLEGTEVESNGEKGGGRVDDLKENDIAVDVVDAKTREIRRSRRGKELEVAKVERKRKDVTKTEGLEDNSTVVDGANGEFREVRRSRRGKLSKGSDVESKAKKVRKVEDLKDASTVQSVLNGDVMEVRRSRRGKILENSDILKDKHSAAGDVPSVNLQDEENIVKKQYLSKRGIMDEKSRENEGVEKVHSSNRNLRSGKEEVYDEDVAGSKEAVTKCASVEVEAGSRRSTRHMAKVNHVQLVTKYATRNKNVTRGRSKSNIDCEVDDLSKTNVVKEGSPVEGNLRRSQRNVSKLECSISLQEPDVITIANKDETKKRRRNAGLKGETVVNEEGGSKPRISEQIEHNTKRSGRVVQTRETGKVVHKKKGRSKTTTVEVDESSSKDITEDPDAQDASKEAPIDIVLNNSINAVLTANEPEFESTILAESDLSMKEQGGTFTCEERNEGNDSKTTLHIRTSSTAENNCTDSNSKHAHDGLDEQNGATAENNGSEAHSSSLCLAIKEKPLLENFKETEKEQPNSEEPENFHTLSDVCEDGSPDVLNDCHSEAIETTFTNADESKQEECTSEMHSMEMQKLREEVSPMQMNCCGPHYLCDAVVNFDHSETITSNDSKPHGNGNAEMTTAELRELKSPDALGRRDTKIQQDGDDNSGDSIVCPSDMQREVLIFSKPSAKAVETAPEFFGHVYDSTSVKSPKSWLPLGLNGKALKPVDLETYVESSKPSTTEQDRRFQLEFDKVTGDSLEVVGLGRHLEMSMQSPTEGRKDVEPELGKVAGEALIAVDLGTHLEISAQSSSEQSGDFESECDKVVGDSVKVVDLGTHVEMSTQSTNKQSKSIESEFDKVVDLETRLEMRTQSPTQHSKGFEPEFDKVSGEALEAVDMETHIEMSTQSPCEQIRGVEPQFDFAGESPIEHNRGFEPEFDKVSGEALEAVDMETHLEMSTQSPCEQRRGVEPQFDLAGESPTERSRGFEPEFDKVSGEALEDADMETHLEMSTQSPCEQRRGEALEAADMETHIERSTQSPCEQRRVVEPQFDLAGESPTEHSSGFEPEFDKVSGEALEAVSMETHLEMSTPSPCEQRRVVEPQFDLAGKTPKAVDLETQLEISTQSPIEQSRGIEPEFDKVSGEEFKSVDAETNLEISTQSPTEQSRDFEPEFDNVSREILEEVDLETHLEISTQPTFGQRRGVEHEFDLSGETHKAVNLETQLEMSTQSLTEQSRGVVTPQLNQDGHSSEPVEVGQLKPLDGWLDCIFEPLDGNDDSFAIPDPKHSMPNNKSNDAPRIYINLIQDQDLPEMVVGREVPEPEESSRYGICSEVNIKGESLSIDAFFMKEIPSTGEDAEIEKCKMSMEKNSNEIADTFADQPDLVAETKDQKIYECGAATFVEMHGVFVGQEEPMNLEKINSNELKSSNHLVSITEVAITDKTDGFISVSVHSPSKNADASYQGFKEDPGVADGSILSPPADIKEEPFSDIVEKKHSDAIAPSSEQRRNGVHRYFLTEAHVQEEQIQTKLTESEEAGHLMDQPAFDSHSLNDKMDSHIADKLRLTQEQDISCSDTVEIAGVISPPPHVATTLVTEGRDTELEFSARKSSTTSSNPPISNSISKVQSVGTKFKSKNRLLMDDNEQNQGHEACFEGGSKEETDSVRVFSGIQAIPTGEDHVLKRSNMLANDEIGSLSESKEPKRNCLDCNIARERGVRKNVHCEAGEPIKMDTCSNTVEADAANSALKVRTPELSFTEPISIPDFVVEDNASHDENNMELGMMPISMGREEDFCQYDEKLSKGEREKEVSAHEDSVDADEDEKQSKTFENSLTVTLKETNGGELKMLFDSSITNDKNNIVQSEMDAGEETLKDAEIPMLSSEIKTPSVESKPFAHVKDAEEEEERGTSLAKLFETQVKLPRTNTEDIVSDVEEPTASGSSASTHHVMFEESEIVDSESVEILSTQSENTDSALQGHLLSVTELVPSVQTEAGNKKIDAADLEHGTVSNLKTGSTRRMNLGSVIRGKTERMNSAAKYTAKRKNARTILIHGTPNKLQMAHTNMKENAPSSKLEKVGSLTTVRPAANRAALKNLPWK